MKKIINNPADFVPEMLDGLLKAHPDQLTYVEDIHSIVRANAPVEGKVALATGGGSAGLLAFVCDKSSCVAGSSGSVAAVGS